MTLQRYPWHTLVALPEHPWRPREKSTATRRAVVHPTPTALMCSACLPELPQDVAASEFTAHKLQQDTSRIRTSGRIPSIYQTSGPRAPRVAARSARSAR